ncbi:MAG: prephenate dehydrogenase [Intestinibacillus sp.]
MKKTVLIVGLGLIGGSMAKAIRANTDCRILGYDISEKVLSDARFLGDIDDIADKDSVSEADIVLVGLYPVPAVEYILANLGRMKKGCIVVDLCGVKQYVCDLVIAEACAHGVQFIGGHPMSGREFSGFEYAQADLFQGASMILVPNESATEDALAEMECFFGTLGFGRVVRTTAEQHDHMIAFTSQLAHVVSSAYIKSPEALLHSGYSAGSYKDLTRVARLNEQMWTELFLRNARPLVREIDEIILHLQEYRDAIVSGREDELKRLLKEGRERKERLG